MGHVLMENRHGPVVDTETRRAAGFAERLTAVVMVDDHARHEGRSITLGADRAYDTRDFVSDPRDRCVTPHVAQNTSGRRSAIDGRASRMFRPTVQSPRQTQAASSRPSEIS
ncbi:hypothetical protein [Sphingomonas sp. GM_Shp_1]|uniref:hypothetical protein n=1 Tax=Sphingomonas sp. GM_Shp_1 TaxID=2937381 RepID=UPI00226B91F2|nr:hypothetical protein [Sphingomonas sp. GM_Shp_1]